MPNLLPRELKAERASSSITDLAAQLVRICGALERDLLLAGPWSMGAPPGPAAVLEEDAVDRFVRQVMEKQRQGIPEVCWLTAAGDLHPPTVAFTLEPAAAGSIAQLRCSLPSPPPETGALVSLVRAVGETFGAYQAYIEDDVLLLRYFSRRATERARAALPPELQQHVPDPPAFDDDHDLDLLVVHDYDRRRVPAGIFWINYWSAELVTTLGEARVRAAGWARVIDAANGALVLAATEEPLDPNDRLHLAQLQRLLANVGLREAQERARHPGGRGGGKRL